MQKWIVICWAFLALVGADECPDGGRCENGQSCCNNPANGYECCPFDQAECCGDHMHCCPGGTICDSDTSSCVNATASFPWVKRASADQPGLSKSFRMIKTYMGEEDDNICPDQSRCPPEFSCLKALTRFGCCPLAQGVPCSDGKHCCPEGHQCSSDSRSCIRKDFVTTVLCSDGVSECPDETTCCETPEGKWGCCPMPKAVCCEDKTHCCPEGTTCDIEHNKCISSSTKKEMPMWAKLPARMRAEWENQKEGEQVSAETVNVGGSKKNPEVTPVNTVPHSEKEVSLSSVTKAAAGSDVPCDDTTACQDGTTCCKTKEGGWACCPLPEAVCCEDFIHCCPKGKTCNLAAQTCDDNTLSVPWVEKVPTIPRQGAQVGNVTCDSTFSCPDSTTCCKKTTGDWGCCPLPQAVCCDDHEHCCPSGTTCDLATLSCQSSSGSTPMQRKMPAFATAAPTTVATSAQSSDVPCDDTTACQDGTTCCKTKEGGWACCPLPEAVCCEDFIHCCPKGKTCNLAAQTCDDNTLSVPWVEKVPTIPRQGAQVGNVTCDSTFSCPDGTTCCKKTTGDWGCCPLPQAVCCDDHEHCCPSGTTCDLATLSCQSSSGSTPMQRKMPAFATAAPTTVATSAQSSDVPCDDTTACQDGTTCCKTKEGGWACCPLPEAVCCEDFIHCCPKGKTCNLAAQTCDDNTLSVPWVEKVPTIPRQGAQVGNVTCDSTFSCPDGTTCCKKTTGDWGCCPLPQAVCCDDHEHCCPSGTTCDLATLSCQSSSGSTPMQRKMPAFATAAPTTVATSAQSTVVATTQRTGEEKNEPEEDEVMTEEEEEEENKEGKGRIQCDTHTSCPQHTTCCFMASSQKWGCCPLPKAVCCADGNHCCPTHYKCNEQGSSCVQGEVVIPWYTKLPATTSIQADPSSVQCDGLSQCPEHTTCCQLSTGQWGCCPLQNAVCCPDKEHCCPQGYTCNVASNSCQKLILLQLETVPLTPVYLSEHQPQLSPLKHRDVQCDEQTSCKDGETCCRMSATTWGCCPYTNAVCCSDMMYCCPTGYTCTESGDCIQNTRLHWYNWHVFVANKKRALIL